MSEHVTRKQLAGLRRRDLPSEELLAALRHLGECAECASLAQPQADLERVRAAALSHDGSHLDAASQMIPYVDGMLDAAEREIVESHFDDCAMCRAEVADLQTLRQSSPRQAKPRWLALAAMAAGAALLTAASLVWSARVAREPVATAPVPRASIRVATPAPKGETRDPRWQKLVDDAVARGTLPLSQIVATLTLPPDALRSETNGGGTNKLAPAGVVLDETRPRLRWDPLNGASYTVFVYDGATQVARSEPLRQPRWNAPTLRRGRTYTWQVEVIRADGTQILPEPPAPPAKFHILDEAGHRELASARAQHPDDHLLHAVLYAHHGLKGDAEASLRRAAAAGDKDARRILETLWLVSH